MALLDSGQAFLIDSGLTSFICCHTIANSNFILCLLSFLGEVHSLFLTVSITLPYLQALLFLLHRLMT